MLSAEHSAKWMEDSTLLVLLKVKLKESLNVYKLSWGHAE